MNFETAERIIKSYKVNINNGDYGDCPEGWASLARKSREKGQHDLESACWLMGAACSLGHNRGDRYESASQQAWKKHVNK